MNTAASEDKPSFWQLAAPAHRDLYIAMALSLGSAVLSLAPVVVAVEIARAVLPALRGESVDQVVIWILIVALVVATFVHGWVTKSAYKISHDADGVLGEDLRQRQLTKLGQLPLDWFTRTSSGKVKKFVQDDVTKIHMLVAHAPVDGVLGVLVPILSLVYLVVLDWRLALLALVPLVLAGVAMPFMMKDYQEQSARYTESLKELNGSIVELIRGIGVIKVFQPEGRNQGVFIERSRAFGRFYLAWVRATVHPAAFIGIVTSPLFGLLLVAIAGPWLVLSQGVSPVAVMAGFLLINNIAAPLLSITRMSVTFREAQEAAAELTGFFSIPVVPAADGVAEPRGGDIAFDELSFAYVEDLRVLDGISATLAEGSVTALVGPSGAGKSTLAQLIPRFLDPTDGSVRIGGIATTGLSAGQLYERVGFVFQDAYLLSMSVRDNIRLSDPEATDEDVERAATAAQIHERILRLPRGYDSVVGEDAQLSGGEQQRLAIARAILRDAPILVLDEATAFADPDSEAAIQKAINTLVKGRTLVVIAHRLHTVTDADRILVLDRGAIVESGTHEELLAAGAQYAGMWRRYQDSRGRGPRAGETGQAR